MTRFYLVALDHAGFLKWLEEHPSAQAAFERYRKLRNQFELRREALFVYEVSAG